MLLVEQDLTAGDDQDIRTFLERILSQFRVAALFGHDYLGRSVLQQALGVLPHVAEAPWSVAEWAVAPRFDNPRATVLVLVLG